MLIFFIAAIVVCFSGSVSAATLEVGPGQTYNNISSAVTAAGTNDVINVHANPTAYNENVVITKSNLTIQANPGDTVNLQTTGNTRFFSITNANYEIFRDSIYKVIMWLEAMDFILPMPVTLIF